MEFACSGPLGRSPPLRTYKKGKKCYLRQSTKFRMEAYINSQSAVVKRAANAPLARRTWRIISLRGWEENYANSIYPKRRWKVSDSSWKRLLSNGLRTDVRGKARTEH